MHKKSDILILLPAQTKPNGQKTDGNAVPRHASRSAYGDYMLSNFWNECHMEWEGISKTCFEYYHGDLKVKTRESISIPASPQYRVTSVPICSIMVSNSAILRSIWHIFPKQCTATMPVLRIPDRKTPRWQRPSSRTWL